MVRHNAPPPIPLFRCNFLTTKKKSKRRGGVYPKERELQVRGRRTVSRGGGWTRREEARRKRLRAAEGEGHRNPATRPAFPAAAWEDRGAALAPTRRLSRWRGLVGARRPARYPPSSPFPSPDPTRRRRRTGPPRAPAASRGRPGVSPRTYLVSSATFLTNRDVLGGRR